MRPKVFIVDDDEMFGRLLSANLGRAGEFATEVFTKAEAMLDAAAVRPPDVVITDLQMPEISGTELTRQLRQTQPHVPIFVLTAYGNVSTAVEALKAGADEYLVKPVNVGDLAELIRKALEQHAKMEAYERIHAEGLTGTGSFLGESAQARATRQFIERIAAVPNATVLVLGESGTGKNVVARALHAAGPRSGRPFVEINCSAIPAHLLEAELFGYVRGAFTDARESKKGLVQVADGGVVFLDEIGDMALELQPKLLSFLESRRFRRLGAVEETEVDVQVVAATNHDLPAEVEAGRFRRDLFYRLGVLTHTLPPLRDVVEDVEVLARHYAVALGREYHKEIRGVSPEALARLRTWPWPGNVRELRNVLERAVIFAEGPDVEAADLPGLGDELRPPSSEGPDRFLPEGAFPIPGGLTLQEAEREYIRLTLERLEGDIQRSAESLGISRKNLWERRKRLGLME